VAALREMLLNALVHKKYGGASIQLRVFDDRLSIWNEGTLPAGLAIESLKTEHNSKPSNPLIADACFKAGYIDTWGRGTMKIYKSCSEAGLPEPLIIEKDGGIEVTLYTAKAAEKLRNGSGTASERLRDDFGTIAEQIRNDFGTKVEMTFDLLTKNPNLTAEQLAEILNITSRTVKNHQAKLKTGGYIERIGDNIGGYWKITKFKRP